MSITELFRTIGRREATSPEWLRGCDAFRRVLELERERADRGNSHFALVTFSVATAAHGPEALLDIARRLPGRLRRIDEAGWIDRRSIGITLPSTCHDGALALARSLVDELPPEYPQPKYAVYTYPLRWPEDLPGTPTGMSATESGRPEASQTPPTADTIERFFVHPDPPWKRTIDIVGALFGLILHIPLFLVVAAAIKLTSPGPVLFSQIRAGRGNKPFRMYKFRSMVQEAESLHFDLIELNEQDGPAFKIKADPRITAVGKFLRATSIDELPQLWNVLRGEMSLVGPRPLPMHESDACRGWQRQRLTVTPGCTCIWQVSGRSQVSFSEWARMDIRYIRRRSPWLDFKLLCQTVLAIVHHRTGV